MNLPLRFWLFALCLSALVGGVAGWQMGRGFSEEPEVAIAQEPVLDRRTVEPVALPAEEEEEIPEPEPPPTVGEPALPEEPSPPRLDFGPILAELEAMEMRIVPVRFLRHLSIPVIGRDGSGELTDEVIELFALSKGEVERVNAAFASAAEHLRTAELDGMEIVNVSETEVVFQLPALGELANHVEETLRQEIKMTLGGADGQMLLDLMDQSNHNYWRDFGREEMRISFTAEPRDNDQLALTVKREVRRPGSETFSHRSSVGTSVSTSSEDGAPGRSGIARQGQRQDYLVELLPDHLRPYFE